MFASSLERVLFGLTDKWDVSPNLPADMRARFEALRGYGRLPRGRENRGTRLSPLQIAYAVLGLTTPNPAWAGHSATVLGGLRPVGGTTASFLGASTLAEAVALLCSSDEAREQFLGVAITMAEVGVNSSGYAEMWVREGGGMRPIRFVSQLAPSLLQPGAEQHFDPATFFNQASRQLVLNRKFFERLVASIEVATRRQEPEGDGSEYDDDDARQARLKALGVDPGSRFLNIGIDTQTTWPAKEILVEFDKFKLVLMPKTADNTQSVHLDLAANRISDEDAATVVNRFLSVMAWCSDQFAISEGGWSGNPVPVGVPRKNLAFVTATHWIFDRCIPSTDEARRALAHYREGCNAGEASIVSYAVLSFFKIIELRHRDGKDVRKWIAANFNAVLPADPKDQDWMEFTTARGADTAESYLWTACRLAVAHASVKQPSDADDAKEIRRLSLAARIMRRLARHFIISELGVSDSPHAGC